MNQSLTVPLRDHEAVKRAIDALWTWHDASALKKALKDAGFDSEVTHWWWQPRPKGANKANPPSLEVRFANNDRLKIDPPRELA